MNKTELVKLVAQREDLSVHQADEVLASLIEQITNALARGEDVPLMGFGRFSVNTRAARAGRNPQTGEAIQIKASKVPAFKASQALKDLIAGS